MLRFPFRFLVIAFIPFLLASPSADAHFGLILPSDDIITAEGPRTVELSVRFMHPMECQYLEMERPKKFGVSHRGSKEDLLATLTPQSGNCPGREGGSQYWKTGFSVKRPGDHVFFVEPAPYWEPAEEKFIIHYTKVCVSALGLEQGWEKPLGLETEIVPLTRPYGLWTNNVFSGRVLLKGKPVPHARVEIEYLNEAPEEAAVRPPSQPFVMQVVTCDSNGVFTYAMPRAGWWGFAALSDASWTIPKDGKRRKVEIGAVYWVRTADMK